MGIRAAARRWGRPYARVNLTVPEELLVQFRQQAPGACLSQILRESLVQRLDCDHGYLQCEGCSKTFSFQQMAGAGAAKFLGELLWKFTELVDRGGSAEGAARVAKDLGVRMQIPGAEGMSLPRPSRSARTANSRAREAAGRVDASKEAAAEAYSVMGPPAAEARRLDAKGDGMSQRVTYEQVVAALEGGKEAVVPGWLELASALEERGGWQFCIRDAWCSWNYGDSGDLFVTADLRRRASSASDGAFEFTVMRAGDSGQEEETVEPVYIYDSLTALLEDLTAHERRLVPLQPPWEPKIPERTAGG
jgi:hypothetical protein